MTRRWVAVALVTTLVVAACSSGDGTGGVADEGGKGATTAAFLTAMADEVIIPSYEALVANLDALDASLASLCGAPGAEHLRTAQATWRDTDQAWESTRASDVGPATDRRLMSAVGFTARPDEVEALLADTGPIDPTALADAGAGVRGIFAVEVALFSTGPPTPTLQAPVLTTAAGARRCTYARSATQLARTATAQVLDDWTAAKGYRATFIAGMDGDPQSSVEALVNELTFRLLEADDQGLRTFAAAAGYDALPTSRKEGPAAFGLASLRAILDVVVAVVLGPDQRPGLADLVRGHSGATADRLEVLARRSASTVKALPDSIAASLGGTDRAALRRADAAVAALRVLVSTTVASQLGLTIGFSDADGDS